MENGCTLAWDTVAVKDGSAANMALTLSQTHRRLLPLAVYPASVTSVLV